MTLITGFVSWRGAVHVSDRLTTVQPGGRPFDPLANKTIVYVCDGAAVVIGYTGLAYLSGRPTDVWIAEQLIGLSAPSGFGTLSVTRRNLHAALVHLQTSLARELACFPNAHLTLLVTGWKWPRRRRKRPSPLLAEIKAIGANVRLEIAERNSWYRRDKNGKLVFGLAWCPDNHFAGSEKYTLSSELGTCRSSACVVEKLTAAIRKVSTADSSVGPHCMVVTMPIGVAYIEVEFVPASSHLAQMMSNTGQRHGTAFPVAYTPWLIIGTNVVAPAVIAGTGWNLRYGDWEVSLRGPDNPQPGILAAWSAQRRPIPPR